MVVSEHYGNSMFEAPAVFELDDDGELQYVAEPPDAERERVQQAVRACPVSAVNHSVKPRSQWRERAGAAAGRGRRARLARLQAAQELRERGFESALTLVGDELRSPYDWPPLSKQVMASNDPPDVTLRTWAPTGA
jgi:ferredoxin